MIIKSKSKFLVALSLLILSGTTVSLSVYLETDRLTESVLELISIFFGSGAMYSFSQTISIRNVFKDSKKIILNDNSSTGDITSIQTGDGSTIYINKENRKIVELIEKVAENVDKLSEENLTKITKKVENELSKEQSVINIPNKDFLLKYIEEAKKISDNDIQDIWTALFVLETKNPNSITIRTLDMIKNMSVNEAKIFNEISKFAIVVNDNAYIPIDISKEVSILSLTKMADIGLLKADLNLTWKPKINPNTDLFLANDKVVIKIANKTSNIVTMNIATRVLTDCGVQIIKAIKSQASDDVFLTFAEKIRKSHNNLSITAHNLSIKNSDGTFRYYPKDLLPPSNQ
jgi:hypothetical protein